MKITRTSALVALLTAGALALAACGSKNDDSAGSSQTPTAGSGSPAASSGAPASAPSSSNGSDTAAPSSGPGTSGSSAATPAGNLTFESAGFECVAGELRSSGATSQGNVMGAWINAYNAKCKATIGAYGGGGSGRGISDFTAKQTDFGGSDSALKEEQASAAKDRCEAHPALDLPMVNSPIAIAYKVSGVDKLVLNPKTLAGIFDNTITKWNDPAIAEINPGVTLPDLAITNVHRNDSSGTTENFLKYLAAHDAWKLEVGKDWVAPGGNGQQGSDGVAKGVAAGEGTIGYVEWGFATDNKLHIAEIDNGSGPVALTAESAGKGVMAAKLVDESGKNLALKLDATTKEAGAYPLVMITYEIVCSAGNGDKAELLKSFLGFAATDGQQIALEKGAAPLPAQLQTKVVEAIKAMK